MEQTAVEWFAKQVLRSRQLGFISNEKFNELLEQAKSMEKKEKLKHSLFIGKVTEILGFDRTVELLKECNDEIR